MSLKLFTSSMIGCIGIHFAVKGYVDQGRDALEHNAEGLYFGEWVELLLDLERKKAKIQAKRDRANCEKWSKILWAIESKATKLLPPLLPSSTTSSTTSEFFLFRSLTILDFCYFLSSVISGRKSFSVMSLSTLKMSFFNSSTCASANRGESRRCCRTE
ncbi:hypothetical protein M0R45_034452 [Rubus argutus]|uniref:Uncharacterized protein n=1 Tax=Rubus argutus TaxID=59490 RepID=A0AAW1VUB5_RUBAR